MTENFNDDEELKYQLENLSALDEEELQRENEMFHAMQQEDDQSKDNNRQTLLLQEQQALISRTQGLPLNQINSPGAAAAVVA